MSELIKLEYTQDHPERRKDEGFVGYVFESEKHTVLWETARYGTLTYIQDEEHYSHVPSKCPCFVKLSELIEDGFDITSVRVNNALRESSHEAIEQVDANSSSTTSEDLIPEEGIYCLSDLLAKPIDSTVAEKNEPSEVDPDADTEDLTEDVETKCPECDELDYGNMLEQLEKLANGYLGVRQEMIRRGMILKLLMEKFPEEVRESAEIATTVFLRTILPPGEILEKDMLPSELKREAFAAKGND